MHIHKKKFLAIDFYEKLISILICLPFAIYLQIEHAFSFESLGVIYLAAGYGHFALAHLYQAKSGKVNVKIFFLYFIVMCGLYYLAFNHSKPFMLAVIAATFLHIFVDEIFLARQQTTRTRYFLAFLLTLILTIFTVDYYDRQLSLDNTLIVLSAIFATAYIYNIYKNGIGPYEIVIFTYAAAFISLILLTDIHPVKIFVFVVIMHYMNWYVRMNNKTKSINKTLNLIYVRDVICIHLLIAFFIFLSTKLPDGNFLKLYFFDFKTGFVWVMLHNIFTLRLYDYKKLFKIHILSKT